MKYFVMRSEMNPCPNISDTDETGAVVPFLSKILTSGASGAYARFDIDSLKT
jgi:hypothetical protein